MLFAANPFARLAFTPLDGNGLNPQLQNPGMVFHPPMLYLGYISITIPYAFAMAALLSRRLDTDWLVAIRKWTLVSWLFLSIGLLLGMWWAYVELGWGDRKSTRLNSSHLVISYAVFCLKKKKKRSEIVHGITQRITWR